MNEILFPAFTFRTLVVSLSSLVWLMCGSAPAQNSSELSAMYGRGVHAYFANQAAEAEELFSQVINAGSTDPRVYYFRAMARIGCGRQNEAEQDMQMGATFEARDPGNRYAISKALERVQGANRRTLESFRQQARAAHEHRRWRWRCGAPRRHRCRTGRWRSPPMARRRRA